MEEKSKNVPRPPLFFLCPLLIANHHDLTSTDPQCPIAETKPL
jgi:hypothetical protein